MLSEISPARTLPEELDALGVLVFDGGEEAPPVAEEESAHWRRRGFKAKVAETLVIDSGGRLHVLVGGGPRRSATCESVRRAGGAFLRAVADCESAAFDFRGAGPETLPSAAAIQAWGEGVLLAQHRFGRYKSSHEDVKLASLVLVVDDEEEAGRALARARAVAGAVNLARDLINEPPTTMTPTRMAEIAGEVAASGRLNITVLDEDAIVRERLGGLLGVARGSAEPPRLVKLEYVPDPAVAASVGGRLPTVALVGKGITFDSGGLSLKSPDGMMTMKTDMSGAAAVIATLGACDELDVPVRVIGIAPITENMPGGRATKPGDVLKIRNGKTIEVLNTDAEGRLVLADGLCLACEEEPDAIIDLATLTGACIVALGREIAGLIGNDDSLLRQVSDASERAGESLWRLPLPEEYRKQIDSEIADMKNMGAPGQAGAIAAALLLAEFVDDKPWAHLDIAGPARSEEERDYLHKGGTGFGVRTLLELLSTYRPTASSGE